MRLKRFRVKHAEFLSDVDLGGRPSWPLLAALRHNGRMGPGTQQDEWGCMRGWADGCAGEGRCKRRLAGAVMGAGEGERLQEQR